MQRGACEDPWKGWDGLAAVEKSRVSESSTSRRVTLDSELGERNPASGVAESPLNRAAHHAHRYALSVPPKYRGWLDSQSKISGRQGGFKQKPRGCVEYSHAVENHLIGSGLTTASPKPSRRRA